MLFFFLMRSFLFVPGSFKVKSKSKCCNNNMPGHVKLGKAGEPDPDPAPYLIVSLEMKREDMLKPYDPKKSVWVPTDDHGFREGLLESDDGTKAVVMCGHEVS